MSNKRVLVLAVHPDDETLGCGGTLFKHRAVGDELHWLIGTCMPKTEVSYAARQREIEQVAQAYRVEQVHQLPFLTTEVDQYGMERLVSEISAVVQAVRPHIVYLPFRYDVHSDHRFFFEAGWGCVKSFRAPFIQRVLMMETLSETDFAPALQEAAFIPNVFVDISEYLQKKLEVLALYKSELGQHPFPRSEVAVKALSAMRGARAGCQYAEAFMLLYERC